MAQLQTTRRQVLGMAGGSGAALLGKNLPADDTETTEVSEPLYLHWMVPPLHDRDGNIEQPPERLVTTLVALSHDFDIALGDPEDSIERIRGRVEARREQFVVDLKASFATGTMYFEGAVQPERIFDSYGGAFGSGIFPARSALSRSRDCSEFLQQMLEGYEEYRPERTVAQ